MNKEIEYCKQCVMDSIGNSDFQLDENGICNYCHEYREKEKKRIIPKNRRNDALNQIVERIKKEGKNKAYDCLIGVSGGVDSTYTAYLVKQLGLRPLAVHFDNGWNSELAVKNIQNILEKLGIDLYTYVTNWHEFKNLQLSFLKASTPDGEIPSDHAILATLYKSASKHKIKYIISGNNFKTEGVMPRLWAYGHIDWKYIRAVHKKFGNEKLKTFPYFTLSKFLWLTFVRKIKMASILNYIDYNKDEAMEVLIKDLEWKYYGGKHYESTYTKFYQGIILPQKFHIDKRKLHLSALILSNQMTREQALEELKKPIYPPDSIEQDKDYVIKKFEIERNTFDTIMSESNKYFIDYPNNSAFHNRLRKFLNYLRTKNFYYN